MKNLKLNINLILMAVIMGFLIIYACKKEEDYPRTRLFSPVLNQSLEAVGNTIIVNLGKMKDAVSYTIEISEDTFKTISYTVEVDTTYIVLDSNLLGEDLWWYTLYQIRGTAHSSDPEYDSKPAQLGAIRTEKFPSNMIAPSSFDILDTKAIVRWVTIGDSITKIKVFDFSDKHLTTPILEFQVTPEARDSTFIIITGMTPETPYWVAIYSGDQYRGWEYFKTIESFISGDNVINLTGFSNSSVLADTLPNIAAGSIILLAGGMTYSTGGYSFDKSVMITKGYSFANALPHIDCSSNFNMADGSTVDSVIFNNISFSGAFDGDYVFNIDKSSTVGEIRFESCQIHSLRGITRLKAGTGTVDKFSVIDCIVDSIKDYAVFSVDIETYSAGDILLENSTFSKCDAFLISRTNTNSITIESCTINETPTSSATSSKYIFRWRGVDGENNVLSGVKIHNTIWGPGWDGTGAAVYSVRGIQGMPATTFDLVNIWATSDFSFSSDGISGFPSNTYSATAADLWNDPYIGLDFNFKDVGFSGKNNSGDPRWRPF